MTQGPTTPNASGGRPFKLLDLTPVGRGNLLARVRLQMGSGMIIACLVIRSKNDPNKIFVTPVAERQQGGGYSPIIEFATRELRDRWQALALEAVKPRLAELAAPTANRREESPDEFCEF